MRLDFTKPIQTRAGGEVRILCRDRKYDLPIVYLFKAAKWQALSGALLNVEHLGTCDQNGSQYSGREHSADLVNVPDKALLDAAPAMLEALKKAINYQLSFEERHNAVSAAIAAATGQKPDGESHVYSRESARQIKIQGQR